ncbi:MAG: putative addiction module antidote protein [Acidobacteriota bacterium]|jgi:probable addiction module antidote protein|nr:putative addiction module antidote protein [Acidobacteriota bacterium]
MKTYKWDPADDIKTKDDVIGVLQAAMEENDPRFLLSVIGDIARSKGMSQLSRELNLNREGLYESLSVNGNPSFLTVVRVLDKLGYSISVHQKTAA